MSNHSQLAESISDSYFTPTESSQWCVSVLKDHGWVSDNTTTLEPCVGAGSLAKQLPGKVIACDLNDHGYPGVIVQDYLTGPQRDVDLVFTNPPFGRMGSLAIKILNRASQDADRLGFILPSSFRKISILDRIDPYLHLVFDGDLPNQNYILPDGSVRWVNTCFQMWERRSYRRVLFKDIIHYSHYTKRVDPTDAEFCFRTQGASAGKVLNGLDYNPASTAFLVGGLERIKEHDWTTIAKFTAGIPAIGLNDVALGLSLQDKGLDITEYLQRGAVAPLLQMSNNP